MKLDLAGRGNHRRNKLLSDFITYRLIMEKWGLEQKEGKAHFKMHFNSPS